MGRGEAERGFGGAACEGMDRDPPLHTPPLQIGSAHLVLTTNEWEVGLIAVYSDALDSESVWILVWIIVNDTDVGGAHTNHGGIEAHRKGGRAIHDHCIRRLDGHSEVACMDTADHNLRRTAQDQRSRAKVLNGESAILHVTRRVNAAEVRVIINDRGGVPIRD